MELRESNPCPKIILIYKLYAVRRVGLSVSSFPSIPPLGFTFSLPRNAQSLSFRLARYQHYLLAESTAIRQPSVNVYLRLILIFFHYVGCPRAICKCSYPCRNQNTTPNLMEWVTPTMHNPFLIKSTLVLPCTTNRK